MTIVKMKKVKKMSWKTDLMILGGIGVGAYTLITNFGGIRDWIAGFFVKTATEEVFKPVYEAGYQAGTYTRETVIEPIYEAGYQTGVVQQQFIDIAGQIKGNIYETMPTMPIIEPITTGTLLALPWTVPLGIALGLFNWLVPARS